jgi:hypothetical protein
MIKFELDKMSKILNCGSLENKLDMQYYWLVQELNYDLEGLSGSLFRSAESPLVTKMVAWC